MSTIPASISNSAASPPNIATATPEQIHWSPSDPLQQVLRDVQSRITPLYPLQDYVAVNPYSGRTAAKFLSARSELRAVSDIEMLMNADYYRRQFAAGTLCRSHIDAALDEAVADGVDGVEGIDVNQIIAFLRSESQEGFATAAERPSGNPNRVVQTYRERIDRNLDTRWAPIVCDEISKHLASHYDQGQSFWPSPWARLPLYQAWQSAARHDRRLEILGITGFREWVANLPYHPNALLTMLLQRLGIPSALWTDFLTCQALAIPGWSAWVSKQSEQADDANGDFAGLLAIGLAYDAALADHLNFHVNWHSVAAKRANKSDATSDTPQEDLVRYVLLKATEIAFRNPLIAKIEHSQNIGHVGQSQDRPAAQMVFCIDVRSERMRRQIESVAPQVETFGFAGFFGVPIEHIRLGETGGQAQVPILLTPQFKMGEQVVGGSVEETAAETQRRIEFGQLRSAWREFQSSAIGGFGFVESTGLWFGIKMLRRTLAGFQYPGLRLGRSKADSGPTVTPNLERSQDRGIELADRIEIAESILRGIGIVQDFAELVIFCGHESRTDNNPLQSGLDCGACGGHSGEINAQVAAMILNQPSVRHALAERDIEIPRDTHFVACVHNTTTDEIRVVDESSVPESHRESLWTLRQDLESASSRVRAERSCTLHGSNSLDLIRRSRDWSETRPEWGLAGNAAFIAAPRSLTRSLSLDGRSFLHSYDYRSDGDFAVLEQIMTAPMIVAHLINMQYYASTVDPIRLGSGNKTIHNVVGRFGLFSGNGGDLMTGLPWQSIHDGENYQHHPLRLLALIAAPRNAIENVIRRNPQVEQLLVNGWIQLVASDGGVHYRYSETKSWIPTGPIASGTPEASSH